MNELILFYLPSCPHCRLALSILDKLKKDDPRFASVSIRMVDESREKALADSYDYWYVPCFFMGREKLAEGHMEEADVRRCLMRAIKAAV